MDIYDLISEADAKKLPHILDHLLFCYKAHYPDWEMTVVTVNKCGNKNEQLNSIIAMLENMKEK